MMTTTKPRKARTISAARRRAAVGCLAAVLAMGMAAASARRAEACGAPDPSMRAWLPAPDQTNVPTNARIWVRGIVGQIRLSAGEGASEDIVDTTLTRSLELPPTVEATLQRPLKPNTTYKVTVAAPQVVPLFFNITTGAGPELAVPAAPSALTFDTREVLSPPTSCGPYDFSIQVSAPAVAGASLYVLERRDELDGGFARLAVGKEPSFHTEWSRLPTPAYRIRPLSAAGLSPDDSSLPVAAATKRDGTLGVEEEGRDAGGCSAATGAVSSPWLLAIWLSQTAAVARRRRRPRS